MKWLLLLVVLMVDSGRGEEASPPGVREKLRARIIESLPPPLPAIPGAGQPEQASPVLVLEPMIVSESKGVRELGKQLVAEKLRQAADSFTPLKGGTIYRSERLEAGAWWTPESGWHFLKLKW